MATIPWELFSRTDEPSISIIPNECLLIWIVLNPVEGLSLIFSGLTPMVIVQESGELEVIRRHSAEAGGRVSQTSAEILRLCGQ
jgi:hypothetical protein